MLDYALWPVLFLGIVATVLMLDHGVPDLVAQVVVLGVAGFAAFGIEQVPEHPAQAQRLPGVMELGHFLLGVQLGFRASPSWRAPRSPGESP